jgi:hypothetical protein
MAALAAAGGVVVAALLLPAAVYGWQPNLDLLAGWYRTVTDTTAPNLFDPENISFATMWAKWIGPGRAAAVLAAVSSALSLAAAAAVIAAGRRVREPKYLELGFLALLIPLLSPQGWDYVLLLALPAFVCLLDRFGDMARGWRLGVLFGLAATSFTIFDLLGRSLYTRLMSISVVTVGAAVLLTSLAHVRRRGLA